VPISGAYVMSIRIQQPKNSWKRDFEKGFKYSCGKMETAAYDTARRRHVVCFENSWEKIEC